jgi:hypothetical protein
VSSPSGATTTRARPSESLRPHPAATAQIAARVTVINLIPDLICVSPVTPFRGGKADIFAESRLCFSRIADDGGWTVEQNRLGNVVVADMPVSICIVPFRDDFTISRVIRLRLPRWDGFTV